MRVPDGGDRQILNHGATKSNPALIGEPGIGKAAIVEGIAHALIRGDVPASIKAMEVYKLDLDRLTSSGLEANLKIVLAEVEIRGDDIIFIDEIHSLLGERSPHLANRYHPT